MLVKYFIKLLGVGDEDLRAEWRALWNAAVDSDCLRNIRLQVNRARPVGQVRRKPVECRVSDGEALLEDAQKDLMINGIKGGRQVQHGESSHTSLVYGCNNVIMYLDQCCLRWVVFTVCRLDRWKKVKQVGVLGEPGINDTFKNLWDKAQVRNWSIWIQVTSIKVGLIQQRTNYFTDLCVTGNFPCAIEALHIAVMTGLTVYEIVLANQ